MSAGARFFDERNNELGWAAHVQERVQGLGSLTVLEVKDPDVRLADCLSCLDHQRLFVSRSDGTNATAYRFRWASGYRHGKSVLVRGVLES